LSQPRARPQPPGDQCRAGNHSIHGYSWMSEVSRPSAAGFL
jgi:hypothetical protein